VSGAVPRQRGLTLVELLVALALQGVLLLMLVQLYSSGSGIVRYQAEASSIQDEASMILSLITFDVRGSGFAGCRSLDEYSPRIIAEDFAGFAGPADTLTVHHQGSGWSPAAGFSHGPGTDVLRVRYAGAGTYLTGNMAAENANIQVAGNPGGLAADDLVLITDCQKSDIFRATSVSSGSGTVTIAHANSNNTDNRLSKKYRANTQVFGLVEVNYFVASRGGVGGLYRQQGGAAPVLLSRRVEGLALAAVADADGIPVGLSAGVLFASEAPLATAPVALEFDGREVNGGSQADHRIRRAHWGFVNLRNNVP